MRPLALILDRDGTLIEHVPYLADPAGVRLLPGARELVACAQSSGCLVFLHTNQSGIGRGWFGMEAVHACNQRLVELLDLGPEPFARICIAPEAPGEPSAYRKPSPRFAAEMMGEFGLDPGRVWYVGDRGADLATAESAGVRGAGVATGLDDLRAELVALDLKGDFPVFDSLPALARYLFPTPP